MYLNGFGAKSLQRKDEEPSLARLGLEETVCSCCHSLTFCSDTGIRLKAEKSGAEGHREKGREWLEEMRAEKLRERNQMVLLWALDIKLR